MYIRTNTINDVTSFEVINSEIYYTRDGNLFCHNKILAYDVEEYGYTIHKNTLIYRQDEVTWIGDKKIDKTIYLTSIKDDYAFFGFNYENSTFQYQNINIYDQNITCELGRFKHPHKLLHYKELGLIVFRNSILAVSLESSDEVWEQVIEFESKNIEKFFGIIDGSLLIACSGQNLLLIDCETGKLNYKWHELKGFGADLGKYKGLLPPAHNFVLDRKNNVLIGTFNTYYFEIDIESRKVIYFELKDVLAEYKASSFLSVSDNYFTDEHFFVGIHISRTNDSPNHEAIIALNRKSKIIDWFYPFKDNYLGTNRPQGSKTHLYQRDIDNNLHVFEKV